MASSISPPPRSISMTRRSPGCTRRAMACRPRDKLAQLFVLLARGTPAEVAEDVRTLQAGRHHPHLFGRSRRRNRPGARPWLRSAPVPLLVSADLEGSRMSLPFGTIVPNPLGLAAVDDVEATEAISTIMAEEAACRGAQLELHPGHRHQRRLAQRHRRHPLLWQRHRQASSATRWRRSPRSRPMASPPRSSTGRAKAMTTATSIW